MSDGIVLEPLVRNSSMTERLAAPTLGLDFHCLNLNDTSSYRGLRILSGMSGTEMLLKRT